MIEILLCLACAAMVMGALPLLGMIALHLAVGKAHANTGHDID